MPSYVSHCIHACLPCCLTMWDNGHILPSCLACIDRVIQCLECRCASTIVFATGDGGRQACQRPEATPMEWCALYVEECRRGCGKSDSLHHNKAFKYFVCTGRSSTTTYAAMCGGPRASQIALCHKASCPDQLPHSCKCMRSTGTKTSVTAASWHMPWAWASQYRRLRCCTPIMATFQTTGRC